ncbi:antirepressor regulating drug resistance protein [Desulfosporosinus orientis DSM 765]|uniref:Antirepressor regulating drug resistance protein n=1 Tax=Desulfosporosinus orientis (strain ATCC 19365 / DSM 765 / NCIMB 8382 / VKM B-1628 / Singapore I) TaxID=768706 RepID=G7WJF3_DESOD|nr:M56 family metallopeptidase [Desulfosporosinus orientis]AET69812.1 antirepressor regulating drug resistance protein [Desulfosporosinus orientis DSM 765]
MLAELFYWVLNMSILGSVAGLLVLSLRKLKILPRFAVYVLWLLPLIRFWLPVGIANQYSLLNLISKFTTKTVIVRQELPQITATNSIMAAKNYFPLEYKTDLLKNLLNVASLIWIIVSCVIILVLVVLYFFNKSELKTAQLISGNIYQSDKITAPAVYGIIRPKIMIPAQIAAGDLEYILLHEQVHITRRDNLLRAIALLTASVHWFNPLSWIFLKYFFADMELACDAKVIKNFDERQTKEYALALLTCASGKAFFASAFGGTKTKLRLERILSYKKLTLFSSLCFAALLISIAVIMLTNAAV